MPYPLKDGGAIAMFNMTKGFIEQGNELTLLVPLTAKHDINKEELPLIFSKLNGLFTVKINSAITAWGAFKNLFTNKPYYLSRYEDKNFADKLINVLSSQSFDIIQVESLKMSSYIGLIRKYSNARVVLRSHNVEFLIWNRMADSLSSGLKKWYLKILVDRLKKYEARYLNLFDAIIPITSVDAATFNEMGCTVPQFPVPSGIDFDNLTFNSEGLEKNSLFHLGALDWFPNLDAVKWFIDDIWPLIFAKYPDAKFYLAGRNMPESLLKIKKQNIVVCGEVEDAAAFINAKEIMVVPLRAGSGMRIKILEGMALGKIIISTKVGAEGIDYTDGENILIADTAEDFLFAYDKIRSNLHFVEKISLGASELARAKYDNKKIIASLLYNYQILNKVSAK